MLLCSRRLTVTPGTGGETGRPPRGGGQELRLHPSAAAPAQQLGSPHLITPPLETHPLTPSPPPWCVRGGEARGGLGFSPSRPHSGAHGSVGSFCTPFPRPKVSLKVKVILKSSQALSAGVLPCLWLPGGVVLDEGLSFVQAPLPPRVLWEGRLCPSILLTCP